MDYFSTLWRFLACKCAAVRGRNAVKPVKRQAVRLPRANRAKPVYAKYIEHVPPDVTAGIFWLKNRALVQEDPAKIALIKQQLRRSNTWHGCWRSRPSGDPDISDYVAGKVLCPDTPRVVSRHPRR
jgi:hypothetical protein